MAGIWNQRITVSENVLSNTSGHTKNINDFQIQKNSKELPSSFLLQLSLYFNTAFLPVWLLIIIIMLPTKYHYLSDIYKFFTIVTYVTSIVTECIRLYLGHIGNLSEKIPEMAAFWMLSILLQAPLQLFFLLNTALLPSILECTAQSIMLVFLIIQLGIGFFALKNSAQHLAERFHIAQFQLNNN
uniref:Transmembrane protein 17 n=1 Tax=Clastoptera arizonana TaxID=38151 RepID=A0A1B6CYK2_9HEMI